MDDVNSQDEHHFALELFGQRKMPLERKKITWYIAGNVEGLVMENIS